MHICEAETLGKCNEMYQAFATTVILTSAELWFVNFHKMCWQFGKDDFNS